MASLRYFRIITALLSIILTLTILTTVKGQPSTFSGSLSDKSDRSAANIRDETAPMFLSRPSLTNCGALDSQIEVQHEGKPSFVKIPSTYLENPRLFDYRYYIPGGAFRTKKSQKAILLDVGDYVIKGNGSPMIDSGAPRSPVWNVGGILRSSGK